MVGALLFGYVQVLTSHTSQEQERAIVFTGHSFDGILIKQVSSTII